ncbi:MAG: tRNA (N6-isopentenyl adenosine(37)-C2)-methylthiotransferase MiaB [Clostridia bacterium]|nr:tRNA (N6-isopentenyl adenosine(37)-C2)-methylthiotransferase MiaB [Clostridia bacterium]
MTVKTDEKEILRQKEFAEKVKNIIGEGKKYLLITLGCQQNESDSEKLHGMLSEMGYTETELIDEADLILYNTCAVRENAEKKLFGRIGALKPYKEKNPDLIIGVCGCMTQQKGMDERFRRYYKYVDMVFGTHSLYALPEILYKAIEDRAQIRDIRDIDGEVTEGIPIKRQSNVKAYLSVMYGCNNFCSYCVVPYVRGRERSREYKDVLDEAKSIAASGIKEIMLLGQNVNSYNGGLSFAELVARVSEIDGIERIRFMSSHPKDISSELIDVMAQRKNVCNQLHLPVQSGSDRILKIMNRRYTVEKYMGIIDEVKQKIPDVTLTTDIIVGFPGETNEDFEKTMELLKAVRYDSIFSFIYSKRKGTPAAVMEDCLTEEEKHINFDKMLKLQNDISLEKNKAMIGSVQSVLVEGESKTDKLRQCGRSEGGKLVHFASDKDLTGEIVKVKITDVNTWTLSGDMI